jgi:hypothetical protein
MLGLGLSLTTIGGNSTLQSLQGLGTLTFYKETTSNVSLDATSAGGSRTATFTASRSASTPKTWYDKDGKLQIETNSNVPVYNYGYYDATGWRYTGPILSLEGASTNLLKDSYFADGTSTYWRRIGAAETIAPSSDYANIYGGGQVIKVSAQDTEGLNTATGSKVSLTAGSVYTISAIIRGSGKVKLRAQATTTFVGTEITLSNTSWNMYSYTFTADVTETYNVGVVSKTNSNVFYVSTLQFEAGAYPSSFIPTTTSALTRNAEALSYPVAGNFPAPYGNNTLSFDGAAAGGDDVVDLGASPIGAGDVTIHAKVFVRSSGEGGNGKILDNGKLTLTAKTEIALSRDGGVTGAATAALSVSTNAWYDAIITSTSAGVTNFYLNGVASGSANQNAGTPAAASTNLLMGNRSAGDRTLDGFLRDVQIWDRILTSGEIATAASGSASTITSGLLRDFRFAEGTGTTLTDGIAANNGTISGATWSKDKHDVTIAFKYRPVMLPNEQPANYKTLFLASFENVNDKLRLIYGTNATPAILATGRSNNNAIDASASAAALSRNTPYLVVATFSTTADANGKKINLYIDGTLVASNTAYAVPAGVLGASFSIQSDTGQAMMFEKCAMWSKVLSAAEVAQLNTILG